MYKQSEWRKKLQLLLILSICPVFAACGGGEEKKDKSDASSGTGGAVLFCIVYMLASGNDECLSYIASGSSSGGAGSSGSDGSGGSLIMLMPIDEYEPNNDWLNANYVDFPKTADRDGFIADGDVHDSADPADVFTFTRTFLRYHAFRLCSDGQKFCDEPGEIDTLTAWIDILDQSGNVVASTQAGRSNFLRLQLAGGVPHYVRVVAGDTMASTVKYHLAVHEANY